MMMGESGKIDWEHMHETLPAFLTIVMMPLTYSITNGMLFGMGASAAFYFTTGNIFRDGVQVLKKYVENGEVDRPLLDDNELGERAIATTYGSVETKD
jgi:AGZA family xanthine/uracil permease-like MFS transporter